MITRRIRELIRGPAVLVKRINEIIAAVNTLNNMTGDGYIQINKTARGVGLHLSVDSLLPRIPRVGVIHKAYVKTEPGAVEMVECYLGNDETNSDTWANDTPYVVNEKVDKADWLSPYYIQTYKCYVAHTSTPGTAPGGGAFWRTVWKKYSITVDCSVVSGEALNSAIPRLVDGELIYVQKFSGTWECVGIPYQTIDDVFTIFKVISNATGDGVYNCKKQIIDATNWIKTDGTSKLYKKNDTLFEVYNTAEDGVAGHVLAVDDYLFAIQLVDDEDNIRWLGWSPKYSWWHI